MTSEAHTGTSRGVENRLAVSSGHGNYKISDTNKQVNNEESICHMGIVQFLSFSIFAKKKMDLSFWV